MFFGTLLLGHVRPAWMELAYTGPYALLGLAIGAALGLIFQLRR